MNSFEQFLSKIQPGRKLVNELKVPAQVLESFMTIGTPGLRTVPELLVLELMREIFYEHPVAQTALNEVVPDRLVGASDDEQLSLEAARGRSRRGKGVAARPYYAPLYPEQARSAALRSKTDRVVRNNFLGGPLAHVWAATPLADRRRTLLEPFVRALYGKARGLEFGSDMLALAMAPAPVELENAGFLCPDGQFDRAIAGLEAVLGDRPRFVFPDGSFDPLARRIVDDLIALCDLEGSVPRLLWIDLLKTFLRVSLSVWVLAQARLTVFLRDQILSVIEGGIPPTQQEVLDAIRNRGAALVSPLTTPSLELHEHVCDYGRARVELTVMLYAFHDAQPSMDKPLSVSASGANYTSVEDLLLATKRVAANISALTNGEPFTLWLRRGCERFPMWLRPDTRGQSKNMDELLRVLWSYDLDDNDDGYLARRVTGALIIFPGSGLTKLMAFLAERKLHRRGQNGPARRLLLQDLELHFTEYGIDFGKVAGSRPRLIEQLAQLGLLRGSPDAGDGAWIDAPMSQKRGSTNHG